MSPLNLPHLRNPARHAAGAPSIPARRWQTAAAACLLMAATLGHAQCTPPPALKARLGSKPTAQTYSALGSWFGDHKQFGCAAQAFASAARLQPGSAAIQYMWGLSLYSAGRDAQAAAPLRKAAALDARDIRPHLALATLLDHQNQPADAATEWRAALAIDPANTTALDGLAHDLIQQKDYLGVVALLDRPGATRPRTPQQNLNLGMAYAGLVKLNDAVRVLREGFTAAPDSIPLADELAVVLLLQSRTEEAYAVLDSVLQKHPADQQTQLLYLRALVNNHSPKAPAMASSLLAQYPDQWEVLYLNAELAAATGDTQQARALLEKSTTRNPSAAEPQKLLGTVLVRMNDLPAARDHLQKAVALDATDPGAVYDLARVLQRLGDTAGARRQIQIYQQLKSAQAGRSQSAGIAVEGDQAMTSGNAELAAKYYREALDENPNEPLLHYKLARALDKTNDIAGEKAALERALQLNPRLAEAQNQMGYLAVRAGDAPQAEAYFRAAVAASPSYIVGWVNLAATLASQARWSQARQAIQQALQIDPENAEARQLDQAITAAQQNP